MALSLAPGHGVDFQRDMMELIAYLRTTIPKVFDSKEYDQQKDRIVEGFQKQQKELFGEFEEQAESWSFKVHRAVNGYNIVAVNAAGEPIKEEEYETFDEQKKAEMREHGKQIQERLEDVVRIMKEEDKKTKRALADLERTAALSVLGHGLEEVRRKHEGNEKLNAYLDEVREDVLANLDDFKGAGEEPRQRQPPRCRCYEDAEAGARFHAVHGERDREQRRGERRPLRLREQPDLLQPLRPGGAQVPDGGGHHRFHHDQGRGAPQGERRLPRPSRPSTCSRNIHLLRLPEAGRAARGRSRSRT